MPNNNVLNPYTFPFWRWDTANVERLLFRLIWSLDFFPTKLVIFHVLIRIFEALHFVIVPCSGLWKVVASKLFLPEFALSNYSDVNIVGREWQPNNPLIAYLRVRQWVDVNKDTNVFFYLKGSVYRCTYMQFVVDNFNSHGVAYTRDLCDSFFFIINTITIKYCFPGLFATPK